MTSFAQTCSIAQGNSLSVKKGGSTAVSFGANPMHDAAAVLKSVGISRSSSHGSIAVVSRTVVKGISSLNGQSLAMARAAARTLAILSANIFKSVKSFSSAVPSTAGAIGDVTTIQKTTGRPLSVQNGLSVTILSEKGKILAFTTAQVVSYGRNLTRGFSIAQSNALSAGRSLTVAILSDLSAMVDMVSAQKAVLITKSAAHGISGFVTTKLLRWLVAHPRLQGVKAGRHIRGRIDL